MRRLLRAFKAFGKSLAQLFLSIPGIILFVGALKKMGQYDASLLAASVAYNALLSIFPLMLGAISLLGFFLPSETVQQNVTKFFQDNFPASVDLIDQNISDIIKVRGHIGIISIFLLLWSGSSLFGVINKVINRAWGIRSTGERKFWKEKPRNFLMALGIGVLLLLSIGSTVLFAVLSNKRIAGMGIFLEIAGIAVAFLFNLLVFILLYKYAPNTKTRWRNIWPGAVFAAALFEAAKSAFAYYLGHFANYQALYGSIAIVIILLVWAYYSAFIMISGAIICAELAQKEEKTQQSA